MDVHLQDKLIEKYQILFSKYFDGFCCGNGWLNLISSLLENLDTFSKREKVSIEIDTIKEKFGTLRVYHNCRDSYVDGLIKMAEDMSAHICEVCGDLGNNERMEGSNWYKTTCSKHKNLNIVLAEKTEIYNIVKKYDKAHSELVKNFDLLFHKFNLTPPALTESKLKLINCLYKHWRIKETVYTEGDNSKHLHIELLDNKSKGLLPVYLMKEKGNLVLIQSSHGHYLILDNSNKT